MGDDEKEKWLELYRAALVELEHARMAGRIQDARDAIVARLDRLQELPGLHSAEREAIGDALNGLRSLEHEEAKYHAAEKQRILDETLQKLKAIEPAVRRLADEEK